MVRPSCVAAWKARSPARSGGSRVRVSMASTGTGRKAKIRSGSQCDGRPSAAPCTVRSGRVGPHALRDVLELGAIASRRTRHRRSASSVITRCRSCGATRSWAGETCRCEVRCSQASSGYVAGASAARPCIRSRARAGARADAGVPAPVIVACTTAASDAMPRRGGHCFSRVRLRYTRRRTRGFPRYARTTQEEMMRMSSLLRGILPACFSRCR